MSPSNSKNLEPTLPMDRRGFLKSTAVGGLLSALPQAISGTSRAAENVGSGRPKDFLGREYTTVFQVPDPSRFVHDPGLVRLPGGRMLATVPSWPRNQHFENDSENLLKIMASDDGGETWRLLCELPYAEATPFMHDGQLYCFVQHRQHVSVSFITSADDGRSWSAPVEVLVGRYWNCSSAMAVKNRRLYWTMSEGFEKVCAVRCDLDQGIMNPKAWTASAMVDLPIPREVVTGTFDNAGGTMRCLEGNAVCIGGRLRILARPVINHYATANMAAIFDISEPGDKLELTFTQLSALPGGQCKFYILYDEPSQLFWMASNLPANTQDLIHAQGQDQVHYSKAWFSPREDRRFLTLSYSLDTLNWFPAGWIAAAEKVTQSFMYPSMQVDGDDLVILSRTARDSGHYHDADLATFHRIRNFRSQAIDIRPKA